MTPPDPLALDDEAFVEWFEALPPGTPLPPSIRDRVYTLAGSGIRAGPDDGQMSLFWTASMRDAMVARVVETLK